MNPAILMQLLPILKSTLSKTFAPNITNALNNGYDPGIMNEIFTNLYNKQVLDNNVDFAATDALSNLDNLYTLDRQTIPTESAYDAAQSFIQNPNQNKPIDPVIYLNNNDDSELDSDMDMLWKRLNGEPMYNNSSKYIANKFPKINK